MENNKMIIYDNPNTGTVIEGIPLSEWAAFNEKHYLVESPILAYTRMKSREIRFLVSGTIKEIEYPNLVIKDGCIPVDYMMPERVGGIDLDTFRNKPENYLAVYYKFNSHKESIKWKLSN